MPLLIGIISAIIIGLLLMVCCCCCLCPSMFLCGCKQCFKCSCCCPSRITCCCCCHMYTRAGTNDGYYVWFSIDTPVMKICIFFQSVVLIVFLILLFEYWFNESLYFPVYVNKTWQHQSISIKYIQLLTVDILLHEFGKE